MPATVATPSSTRARGTRARAPKAHGFRSAAEMREVLDRTLAAANADPRVGPLLQATDVRMRIECPDVNGVVEVAASSGPGSYIEWRFDRRAARKPKLVLTMDSDVANEWLQGRESVPMAIAHRRMTAQGEARCALFYLPTVKLISGIYRRLIGSEYPHLAL